MNGSLHPILATAIAEWSSAALLVYADVLEEQGDPMAEGWRRLADEGFWFEVWTVDEGSRAGSKVCYYRNGLYYRPVPGASKSNVPEDVFRAITKKAVWSDHSFVDFDRPDHALTALAEALAAGVPVP